MSYAREQLKKIYTRVKETPFQQGWEFRVEIEIPSENLNSGIQIPDLDIFMKSFTHGGFTVDYRSQQVGAANINSAESKSAGSVSCVVRDNRNGDIEEFFRKLQNVVNPDGTVNLPPQYLFYVKLYRPDDNGNDKLRHRWYVSAESLGELARAHSQVNEFTSFEMSFKKYRS